MDERARFEPVFAGFAARVRGSFAKQGAMALIGARLDRVDPGHCVISLAPRDELSQQHGYVHGGIIAAIVDSAGGYAGFTLFPEDSSVLTVEFKLNLLAPAAGDRLVAEAFVIKPGRTLVVTRGEVHAERAGSRTLVALMQQTLMVMPGRLDAPASGTAAAAASGTAAAAASGTAAAAASGTAAGSGITPAFRAAAGGNQ